MLARQRRNDADPLVVQIHAVGSVTVNRRSAYRSIIEADGERHDRCGTPRVLDRREHGVAKEGYAENRHEPKRGHVPKALRDQ